MMLNSDKLTPVPYAVSSVPYIWSKTLFIGMNKGSDTLAFCFPSFFLVLLINPQNIRRTSGTFMGGVKVKNCDEKNDNCKNNRA